VRGRLRAPRLATTTDPRLFAPGSPLAAPPGGGRLADLLSAEHLALTLPLAGEVDVQPLHDYDWLDPWSAEPSRKSLGFVSWWRDQPPFTFAEQWTDPRWADRSGYLRDPSNDPIDTPGWKYVDTTSYRTNSYARTAVALRTLSWLVGWDNFLRGMRHYAETWRFRHPYPDDFFKSFQEGAGADVQWYFDEVFRGTGTLDWSVGVDQERRSVPAGLFQKEDGTFLQRTPAENETEESQPWRIDVVLRTKGGLHLPVTYRMTFADGRVQDVTWTREEQLQQDWKRIHIESESKLESVVLDPSRGCFLDSDMSDNQWYDEVDDVTPWRWGERVLAQYQRYFHWIAGIGG